MSSKPTNLSIYINDNFISIAINGKTYLHKSNRSFIRLTKILEHILKFISLSDEEKEAIHDAYQKT